MNRSDLIKRVAGRLLLDDEEAATFIRVWEEEVEKALIEDGEIGLMGFGSFSLWKQTARPGRNPRANVFCMIAPRNSVKFKPGKFLLEHLNPKKEEPDENV
ncbi:HU family DNA-binding protein [Parabacteroides gordonii]|uniref:HU family DNA-binding protein n=1 Tax=Parabacteroides gordonii TaxID=574930 RepID=UPI0026EF82B8|nr:HU family DNA-binding protein [Parabacteroides gordonii]